MHKEEINFLKSLDLKFVPYLKDNRILNFKCLACREGKSYKTKTRMFYIGNVEKSYVMCHNCGYHNSFRSFIKDFFGDSSLDLEGILREETYRNFLNPKVETDIKVESKPKYKYKTKIDSIFLHKEALDYVKNRKIDRTIYKKWFANSNSIIIPLYNEDLKMYGYQYRYINPNSKCRYKTIIFDEYRDSYKKIYNYYNMLEFYENNSSDIFVCEGVFDSATLLSLGIQSAAIFGASIPYELLTLDNTIIVLDNDDRGKLEMNKLIKQHPSLRFLVIPNDLNGEKIDINDYYIKYGKSKLLDMLNSNIRGSLDIMLELS